MRAQNDAWPPMDIEPNVWTLALRASHRVQAHRIGRLKWVPASIRAAFPRRLTPPWDGWMTGSMPPAMSMISAIGSPPRPKMTATATFMKTWSLSARLRTVRGAHSGRIRCGWPRELAVRVITIGDRNKERHFAMGAVLVSICTVFVLCYLFALHLFVVANVYLAVAPYTNMFVVLGVVGLLALLLCLNAICSIIYWVRRCREKRDECVGGKIEWISEDEEIVSAHT